MEKIKSSSDFSKTGKLKKHFTSGARESTLPNYCNSYKKIESNRYYAKRINTSAKDSRIEQSKPYKEVICTLIEVTITLILAFRGKADDDKWKL